MLEGRRKRVEVGVVECWSELKFKVGRFKAGMFKSLIVFVN